MAYHVCATIPVAAVIAVLSLVTGKSRMLFVVLVLTTLLYATWSAVWIRNVLDSGRT